MRQAHGTFRAVQNATALYYGRRRVGFLDRAELHRTAEQVRFGATERFADFLTCLACEYWLRAATGAGQETGRQARAWSRARAQ